MNEKSSKHIKYKIKKIKTVKFTNQKLSFDE